MSNSLSIYKALKVLKTLLICFRRVSSRETEEATDGSPLINKTSAKLVLVELQRMNDIHLEASDELNQKAISLVGWASLTLALVSALGMKDLANSSHKMPFVVLGVTVILYLTVLALGLSALSLEEYLLPISTNWEDIADYYLGQSEQDAVEQLLSQYIYTIDHNRLAAKRKARLLTAGFYLFLPLVAALMILLTHPLWQNYFI